MYLELRSLADFSVLIGQSALFQSLLLTPAYPLGNNHHLACPHRPALRLIADPNSIWPGAAFFPVKGVLGASLASFPRNPRTLVSGTIHTAQGKLAASTFTEGSHRPITGAYVISARHTQQWISYATRGARPNPGAKPSVLPTSSGVSTGPSTNRGLERSITNISWPRSSRSSSSCAKVQGPSE